MNIKDTFIRLTSRTYPFGCEQEVVELFPKEINLTEDGDGNYFYKIGNSRTIFTSHLDTACKNQVDVNHKISPKYIKTDGKSILGADDKAGITIMLYMIHHKVPGLYYFFFGEEVGCIGSTEAAKRPEFFSDYNKMVSFDRRGTNSVITFQSSKRTCSDEFADSLAAEYNKHGLSMKKDNTGIYTDSAEFANIIPECTNISVGYYNEHTHTEYQDIRFLESIAKASVLVNWDSLSIKRDPTKTEYKEYNYYGGAASYAAHTPSRHSGGYSNRNYYGGFYGEGGSKKTRRGGRKNTGANWDYDDKEFFGKKYNKSSDFYYKGGKKVYYNDIEDEMMNMENSGFSSSFINKDSSIKINTNLDIYGGVKDMLLSDKISISDFRIIKEQFLDITDESDAAFSKDLESLISIDDI